MTKYKRPSSSVVCANCNISFLKENRLIKVSEDKGKAHCCSKKCSVIYSKNLFAKRHNPFKYYLLNVKKRSKTNNKEYNIDEIYLEELWNQQEGLCAISKLPLIHATLKNEKDIYQASIDRIDNSKWYVKGNIHFVSLGMNYLRNTFSIEEVEIYLEKIKSI